jgi:hypothetical protein
MIARHVGQYGYLISIRVASLRPFFVRGCLPGEEQPGRWQSQALLCSRPGIVP